MPAFLAAPPFAPHRPGKRYRYLSPRSAATPHAAEVVVIGGGAAGYYLAIACARLAGPAANVRVLEAGPRVLQKVRISGGGRCNVTSGLHHDDSRAFASNYPRGSRALVGVLSRYGAPDVVAFFENAGVPLKMEPSGKIFPVSDSSESVIEALENAANEADVVVNRGARVRNLVKESNGRFLVRTSELELHADYVAVATGSARAPLQWAAAFGHNLVPQVPSLFSFKVHSALLTGLAGVAVADAQVRLEGAGKKGRRTLPGLTQRGAILITHWGISGPAVLSASAFGARFMHDVGYLTDCIVDWIPSLSLEQKLSILRQARKTLAQRNIRSTNPFRGALPKRLWMAILEQCGGEDGQDMRELRWGSVTNAAMNVIGDAVHRTVLPVSGKGEFKDEFVTAGGVPLSEINTKSFESKKVPGLYFAGEILDVDGKTGGFNLEFAWSSGHIAGTAIAEAVVASHIKDTK